VTVVAAIPYDVERNLGRAYNGAMEDAEPGQWVAFLDHDAMLTTGHWRQQLTRAIADNPHAGLITAVTNRIGCRRQVAPGCPDGHRLHEHWDFGRRMVDAHGSAAVDVTGGPRMSGVLLCLSRETWERIGGFRNGFFGVDNRAHESVKAAGLRVYMMPGLYLYHWYRGDGVAHEPGAVVAR